MAPHQMGHPLALQSIGQYGTLPKHMGGHMMDAIRVLPPGPHPGMATLGRKSEYISNAFRIPEESVE